MSLTSKLRLWRKSLRVLSGLQAQVLCRVTAPVFSAIASTNPAPPTIMRMSSPGRLVDKQYCTKPTVKASTKSIEHPGVLEASKNPARETDFYRHTTWTVFLASVAMKVTELSVVKLHMLLLKANTCILNVGLSTACVLSKRQRLEDPTVFES